MTTSLSGISLNRLQASLVRPLSKYDLMRFVAQKDGPFGVKGGFDCKVELLIH